MPWLVVNAGDVLFILGVANDKAEACTVGSEPLALVGLVDAFTLKRLCRKGARFVLEFPVG